MSCVKQKSVCICPAKNQSIDAFVLESLNRTEKYMHLSSQRIVIPIKDIYVNLDKKVIEGFEISNYSFLGKKNFLNTKDINYFTRDKIIGEFIKDIGL